MNTLTKQEIQEEVELKMEFSKKKAVHIVEDLIEIMKSSMENGDDVLVSGFGKFCVVDKKTRLGRNPATGKRMKLEKRRVVTFKCSTVLRDKINPNGSGMAKP